MPTPSFQSLTAPLLRLLSCLFLAAAMAACTGTVSPGLLANKVVLLTHADFGPPDLADPLLGPGTPESQVVVHYALSPRTLENRYPSAHYVPVVQALRHLNRSVSSVPKDAGHTAMRARLIATRSQLMDFYNTRRASFNSLPPSAGGRAYLARQMMMPAIGTTR